jgi:hypothetical protein
MIDFQLVVQHRAAGVLTSTNFNLDALVLARLFNEVQAQKMPSRMVRLILPEYLYKGLAYNKKARTRNRPCLLLTKP